MYGRHGNNTKGNERQEIICIMYRMAQSSAVIMSVKSVEAGFWIVSM